MANRKTGRLIGAIIVLIGAIVLITALFMPWYTEKVSIAGETTTVNFFPGLPSQSGAISWSCSGGASCPSNETSYSGFVPPLTNVGNIAETGFFLLILGFIIGIVATAFGAMSRGNSRRVAPAIWLTVIAVILALIAPILFAATLPGAISKDIPSTSTERFGSSSGPWSTFMGSTSIATPFGSVSLNWGPGIGWYMAFAAFVVLLIGLILLLINRKDLPEPAPTTAAAPAPTPAATPPAQ